MELNLSLDSKRVIRDILISKDKNGNGVIDADELGDCLRLVGFSPTPEDIAFLTEQFDINGDGDLQIDELMNNLDVVIAHSVKGPELLDAFVKFDIAKNGFIRREQFYKILTAPSAYQLTPEEANSQIDNLLSEFDDNKDGKISYPEFVRMFMRDGLVNVEKF